MEGREQKTGNRENLTPVFWFLSSVLGRLSPMSRKMDKAGHEVRKKPKLSKKEKKAKKRLKKAGT